MNGQKGLAIVALLIPVLQQILVQYLENLTKIQAAVLGLNQGQLACKQARHD